MPAHRRLVAARESRGQCRRGSRPRIGPRPAAPIEPTGAHRVPWRIAAGPASGPGPANPAARPPGQRRPGPERWQPARRADGPRAITTAGRRAAATSATAPWPPCVTTTSAQVNWSQRACASSGAAAAMRHSKSGLAAAAAATASVGSAAPAGAPEHQCPARPVVLDASPAPVRSAEAGDRPGVKGLAVPRIPASQERRSPQPMVPAGRTPSRRRRDVRGRSGHHASPSPRSARPSAGTAWPPRPRRRPPSGRGRRR